MTARCMLCAIVVLFSGCAVWDVGPDTPFLVDNITPPQRLRARSPWYSLADERHELHIDYCGWNPTQQKRVTHLRIGDKVKRMVQEANELVLLSTFLFDNLYADAPAGDYVGELGELLIAKKKANPSMPVVLILDQMHKGWGHRKSRIVDRMVAAGIDVFYSDILETHAASRVDLWESLNEVGREADRLSGGVLGLPCEWVGRVPLPVPGLMFDDDFYTLDTLANASLLKANHRKALVVKRDGVYEMLTTSWNPHNPSQLHENHAVSVTGRLACYVYQQLREDIRTSMELGGEYVQWSSDSPEYRRNFLRDELPALPESSWREEACTESDGTVPDAAVASEEAIEPILMQWLKDVGPDDRVRIQMFYLSRVPVVNALLDAAGRTRHPIQILLDPNRVGIKYQANGTPNAQVADYLIRSARNENARLEVRWYATRGEQNHAKAMTITNERTGKYRLCVGSTNWTRKNLAGINMEYSIFVRQSAEMNGQFNAVYDRLWSNGDAGVEYSIAWDDPRYNYHRHSGQGAWAVPRRKLHLAPQRDSKGRPQLLEQELVHW